MRPRAIILTLVFSVLAALAVGGWSQAWRERERTKGADFLERRLALLEADNQRLAKTLADQRSSAVDSSERTHRGEIEQTVSRLRGLPFERPVTYREIPRADLPAILRRKLAQQVPDQEFANAGVSLSALGLLPPGIDLRKTYLDLLGEQIGAFYDQHSAELFTFSGQSLDNSQNRVVLAHELTHALEDQHFHLARLPLETKGNDDRALAASALVEGDATLVMSQYMLGDFSAVTLKDTLTSALTTDMRQLASAPRYLRETLLFPYLRGQEFCQTLFQTGGWEALAEAFHNPPDSTSQILHPERFLNRHGAASVTVNFPATAVLGESPVGDNVLGEFGVRQLLGKWLRDEPGANSIAAGWLADRYLVYGDAKTNSCLWTSVWSSPGAATGFADALARCWRERYHLDASTLQAGQSAALPGGRRWLLVRENERVSLVDAQDARWEAALRNLLANPSPASAAPDAKPR